MKNVIILILFLISVSCKNQTEEPVVAEDQKEQKTLREESRSEKSEMIVVTNPKPDQLINSPLEIRGKARGYWFFEADAPVEILDKDLNKIAESYIIAEGEWMTKDFVQFSGTIEFNVTNGEKGYLVFKRANPSDLKENDAEHRIPIIFSSK